MELNSELITVQGILRSLVKSTGDFTKMRHKGGNENKISLIVKEIEDFMSTQKYIRDRKANPEFRNEIQDIVFFLTLNSEFNDAAIAELSEFAHLINICPILSKFLLLNIIIELNLVEYYGFVLKKLPISLLPSLVNEIVPNIKRLSPKQMLDYGCMFLKDVYEALSINKPDDSSYKFDEVCENVSEVASEILLMISAFNPEKLDDWKKADIYQHMGQTLLNLLKLLQLCDVNNSKLNRFVDHIIRTCCIVIKSVTIHVYCSWVEVKYDGDCLQTIVGEQAFHVLQKYQKYESAKDLMQMLVTVAKKPKSLSEMIQGADQATIINKVDLCDIYQQQWFTALLTTQIFESIETMNCMKRWSQLCTIDDMNHVLNQCVNNKSTEARKIALKCAATLKNPELIVTCVRFYYKHGLSNALHIGDIMPQLTLILNKLENNICTDDHTKELLILILQNPKVVVDTILSECVKNSVYTACLRNFFKDAKELLEVQQLLLNAFIKLIEDTKPNEVNRDNYTKLIDALIRSGGFTWDKFVHLVIYPYVEKYQDDLELVADLFNALCGIQDCKISNTDNFKPLFALLLKLLHNARCTLFDFSYVRCELITGIVFFLIDHRKHINEVDFSDLQAENYLNNYYLVLYTSPQYQHLFDFLFTQFNVAEEVDCVSKLLKVLPACVENEWIRIFSQIVYYNNKSRALQLATSVVTMLAEVAKTQKDSTSSDAIIAFKYYLTCYSSVIQNLLKPDSVAEATEITTNVCRIIGDLPDEMKEDEGMKLISLMPEISFRGLSQDKTFVCLLVNLGNKTLSQIIAKKLIQHKMP